MSTAFKTQRYPPMSANSQIEIVISPPIPTDYRAEGAMASWEVSAMPEAQREDESQEERTTLTCSCRIEIRLARKLCPEWDRFYK